MAECAISQGFDADPRSAPGAGDVDPLNSRLDQPEPRFAGKAATRFLENQRDRDLPSQPRQGLEGASEIMIALVLDDFHGSVQMDANGVRADDLRQPLNLLCAH